MAAVRMHKKFSCKKIIEPFKRGSSFDVFARSNKVWLVFTFYSFGFTNLRRENILVRLGNEPWTSNIPDQSSCLWNLSSQQNQLNLNRAEARHNSKSPGPSAALKTRGHPELFRRLSMVWNSWHDVIKFTPKWIWAKIWVDKFSAFSIFNQLKIFPFSEMEADWIKFPSPLNVIQWQAF